MTLDPFDGEGPELGDYQRVWAQQQRDKQIEQNERHHKEEAARRQSERRAHERKPQCPYCGGRLDGEFELCMHCRSPLSWVGGVTCKPGEEAALRSKQQRAYEQAQKQVTDRAASLASLARAESQRKAEVRKQWWQVFVVISPIVAVILVGLGIWNFVLPNSSSFYVKRAETWGFEDRDRAIEDYNEAIRRDPKNAHAYLGRARYWSYEYQNKSLADCTEAIRLDPKNASAYDYRGRIWARSDQFDKAFRDYNEAMRLDPKNDWATKDRRHEESTREAIEECDEAIQLAPDDAALYLRRGSLRAITGEYGGSIRDFTESIRVDPKHAKAYMARSYVRAHIGEYEKAARDKVEALRLNGYEPSVRFANGY